MITLRTSVELTHQVQNQDRYLAVPFEVPQGASSLQVSIEVDHPEAVIDLGCEGADGWRGWSGGARRQFVITAQDATPGYLPGAPEAGTWSVILGVHVLPADPVTVSVQIDLPATAAIDHGPVATPLAGVRRGSDRALPAPAGMRWYAGDFHGHTLHSDGAESLSALARLGVESGLDFLAITDHNTTSHHAHLPGIGAEHQITLIPGQEVTTHRGHANAFGDIGFIDFRRPAPDWVQQVAERGGVLSINHPISGDCSWQHDLPVKPGAIEVWHSTWFLELISTAPLAFQRLWDSGAALIGGTDFHHRTDGLAPGTPTTWIAATEDTVPALLDGLKAGRTAITGSSTVVDGLARPDLFDCPILVRVDGALIALAAQGMVLVDGQGRRTVVTGEEFIFDAPRELGPYQLLHPDRRIAALSP